MFAVYIEVRDGRIKPASLETLGEAKRRGVEAGRPAAAVFVGSGQEGLAAAAFAAGADRVFLLENAALSAYSTEGYAHALAAFVAENKPAALFFAATAMGRDLAPRLAAKLACGLASDCTKVSLRDGRLDFVRPIFAGKALLTLRLKTDPQIATLRPNVFPQLSSGPVAGEAIKVDVAMPEGLIRAAVGEFLKPEAAEIDVAEAGIVVSGGRGLKGPEGFGLLRELAATLPGAAVGASRSAVDAGWIEHSHQVGQTGKTVSPDLYIAIGISGAIQHLAGMSSAKVIAAINKDPEAPIFKVADYGVVGDLFQVVPHLTAELKKLAAAR